jgi:hypothetical protein
MKFQFTYAEFKEFESDLIIMGFRKYNGKLHSEDYYFAKTIHRSEPDEDGYTRSDLQLFLSVSDFSKHPRFDQPDFMCIQAEVHISRNIDERIDLVVNDKICKSIHDLELFAFKFYEFITSNVPE